MSRSSLNIAGKVQDYRLLIKFSLSFMVAFSAVISYLLAPKVVAYDWSMIILIFTGGLLITGSANAVNEIAEKDTDAQMKRTANRPIAAGRMSVREAGIASAIMLVVGMFIMWHYFNGLSAAISLFSWFVYAYLYTPLKKVSAISVLVGAIPGALPCLIGWAAGNDDISVGGWVLFALQFFWQFPHFWAIAWVAHKDYSSVGFKLLPADEGPTKFTALQAIAYSLLLVPVTLAPYYTGMCNYNNTQGIISLILIGLANLFMIGRCVMLYRKMDVGSARKVMFGSYMYLPVVMLAFLLSKA
ncbi:MAG: heme o synthase [Chitinophagaceae bacterium]